MLERLEVRGFRNLADLDLRFTRRFTVFVGPNGAGKTNLLEAVYLAAYLRSFRCGDLGALVGSDATTALVTAHVRRHPGDPPEALEVRLDRTARGARRTALVAGKRVRRLRDFFGRLKVVLFSPEDLTVLRSGPAARRDLLDRAVAAAEPVHLADLADYDKLVRSRNRLLAEARETGRLDEAWLATYDASLAELGGRIWVRRTAWVEAVRPVFVEEFAAICGPDPACDLAYVPRIGGVPADAADAAARLRAALEEGLAEDRRRGRTGAGPHRDDLAVTLGGRPAASFASQGQTRALVLALKLAELSLLAETGGARPTLLLDVSSELDPERTARLFAVLSRTVDRCLLSTTDRSLVAVGSAADRIEYAVRGGRVEPLDAPFAARAVGVVPAPGEPRNSTP